MDLYSGCNGTPVHAVLVSRGYMKRGRDERTETVTEFRICLEIPLPRPHREEPL